MPIHQLTDSLRGRSALVAFTLIAFALGLPGRSLAQTETVTYSFTGAADGAVPSSSLVADSSGNYYGTTFSGGSYAGAACQFYGCGTVFELSPNHSGDWTETTIYTFTGGTDGAEPAAALVFDALGNLYGTTTQGGIIGSCSDAGQGCGVVFELSPSSSGGWTESLLYSFVGGNDGWYSEAPLTFDSAGNLYGTTSLGGPVKACNNSFGCGEVFKLTPNGFGGWQYSVVYSFKNGKDGGRPYSGVVVDSAGDIFTTTIQGGSGTKCGGGCGTLVEFTPNGAGGYMPHMIHSFSGGRDGGVPEGGLMLDASGNIYGTALIGGFLGGSCRTMGGCGLVFKLSPRSGGGFVPAFLYTFLGGADGYNPVSVLTMDTAGNLYGAAYGSPTGVGDCGFQCGSIYKLAPNGIGGYTQSVAYAFPGGANGGILNFLNGLTLDASGNIFGTTTGDGIFNSLLACANGCGVAYKITP
jgi:hypothetical protein